MKLVGVLASVITDERRFDYFKLLLESIRRQETPLDIFIVSIHFDFDHKIDLKELFRNFPCPYYILRQKRPKRQFLQYGEIMNRLPRIFPRLDNETFILFSDDDDLWNTNRVSFYKQCGQSIIGKPVSSVVALEHTVVLNVRCSTSHSPTDVGGMLKCGCVQISMGESVMGSIEYHEHAVRHHVAKDFFDTYPVLANTNRFADIAFRDFVRTYKPKQWCTAHGTPPTWLYFYRECDDTYACVTNPAQKKGIDYIGDMLTCPGMEDMAFKQHAHLCDAIGHEKVEKGLLQMGVRYNECCARYFARTKDSPKWQARMMQYFPTTPTTDLAALFSLWLMWENVFYVHHCRRRTGHTESRRSYYYYTVQSATGIGPFDTREQAKAAAEESLVNEPIFKLISVFML